jgi:fatty-acyl-CoA synthase
VIAATLQLGAHERCSSLYPNPLATEEQLMTDVAGRFEQAFVPLHSADLIEEVTVGDVLRRATQEVPDAVALVEGLPPGQDRREWTYSQLLAESERAARALLEHVEPGEAVALWAHNVPEWILAQMAAALAGVTLVTVNPALTRDEVGYILRNSGAVALFYVDEYRNASLRRWVEELAPRLPALRTHVRLADWKQFCARGSDSTPLPTVRPDDVVQIQYTSGTTGLPKGARLRHRGIVNNPRLSFADRLPSVRGATLVHAMPLFHTAGSVLMTLGAIQTHSTQVLMPHFDPEVQLALIESERSILFGGVPTMLRALLDHPRFGQTDLSSAEIAISGGSLVEPQLVREVEDRVGVRMLILYGQTECSPGITMTHPDDPPEVRAETAGRTLPGVEMKLVDPKDLSRVVAVDEVGEVCTRGYHVMVGYHDDPARSAETIDADQWLHTGDLGRLDADGNLRIVGRLKDMVIRGGENIYPSEIETALLDHEAIAAVAVTGVPDAFWGEEVAAFVKLGPGAHATPELLSEYAARRLAKHKVPRHWYFLDEFPLNATGKILKTELRDRATRELGKHT